MIRRGMMAALCGAVLFAAQAVAAPYYVITDLGFLSGGTESVATAINSKGQVVGYGNVSGEGFETHAFLWDKGEMTDLGTLGGGYSAAYGINGKGVVVGESNTYEGYLRPFAWNVVKYKGKKYQPQNGPSIYGEMVDLGTLGEEFLTGSARGINDNGAIVGYSSQGGYGAPQAGVQMGGGYVPEGTRAFKFAYSPKKQTVISRLDLGTLGGPSSAAFAIRNDGLIAGWADLDEEGPDGFIHHAFVLRKGEMEDFGTLPGESLSSAIYALNRGGNFAGASDAPYYVEFSEMLADNATRWDYLGHIRSLGALPGYDSVGYGINSSGVVVGECSVLGYQLEQDVAGGPSMILPSSRNRAFVWFKDTGILDLNSLAYADSPWILNAAYGINDRGQIVGAATLDEETHAVLLTPVSALPPTTTVSTTSTTTASSSTTTTTFPN